MSLDILYEDNHLLAINKPAGLLTQPSGTVQDNLEDQTKAWIKKTYHKAGNVFLGAPHRLDKPVSGVVLFARTSKSLSRLHAFLREKRFHKCYLAVVQGKMPAQEGMLKHYLQHDNDFHAQVLKDPSPRAKFACLTYRVLAIDNSLSVVEVSLETGRYHQIRVQLSAVGCPIVGDMKYGSSLPLLSEVIALHHYRLTFPHPITQEQVTCQAPLPSYWPFKGGKQKLSKPTGFQI